MKTNEILEDWFLDKFEVQCIKDGLKTILILPENYSIKFKNILFVSGLSLKVNERYEMTLNDLLKDRSKYNKIGVKSFEIPACCEHPELICYAYCSYEKNNYKSFQTGKKALEDHFFNELNLDKDKLFTFIEFTKI